MRQHSVILWFVLLVTCRSKELPDLKMVKNRVTIEFDGQPLRLWVDTGSTRLLVVGKKSYEDIHDRPCDFTHAPKYTVEYSSFKVLEYVLHKGTLRIGDVEMPEFVFGIVVNATADGEPVRKPEGQLGLSFGRPDIPVTFLEQLKEHGLMKSLSFSINPPTWWNREGSLVLGRLSGPQISWKFTSIVDRPDYPFEKFFVRVSAIRVISDGSPIMSMTPKRDTAFVDSGNDLIRVPPEVYQHVVAGLDPAQIAIGRGVIERSDIRYKLPDLEFVIVDGDDDRNSFVLRVSVKDYVVNYPSGKVAIHVRPSDSLIFFGQPLFGAYSVYFDMENKKVAFREKAVVRQVSRRQEGTSV
ncbi:hypothetical protein FOL47_010196 [Perkinsus chesapeaki]|uniref:Peptidase A1 domain-containing protein n=1 Tax=Perkinsus chesapeaki TaxID=330153 RepID=A0A7J6MQ56_PERCH|nr:hypothetical protein FOL47_010196 [Perkinsus chesapeaki]